MPYMRHTRSGAIGYLNDPKGFYNSAHVMRQKGINQLSRLGEIAVRAENCSESGIHEHRLKREMRSRVDKLSVVIKRPTQCIVGLLDETRNGARQFQKLSGHSKRTILFQEEPILRIPIFQKLVSRARTIRALGTTVFWHSERDGDRSDPITSQKTYQNQMMAYNR